MNTTDKNQLIEQISNWQAADPENRTTFVVLIEDDIFSSTNTSSNENSCYTSTTFKFTKSKQTNLSV